MEGHLLWVAAQQGQRRHDDDLPHICTRAGTAARRTGRDGCDAVSQEMLVGNCWPLRETWML